MKHIFRLTIKEIASKRLFYLGLVFTLIYLGLIALGEYYAARDMSQGPVSSMMVTIGYQFMCLGWYISTLMIGTLCIALASGSLSREIESGTILGLASRPLGRGSILIGKFTAYLSVMVLYSVILLLAISLISSYYFKMPLETLSMIKGIGIFIMYPMVLLALTFFFSASLSTMAGGVTCFMLLIVAIIGGFIEQVAAIMQSKNLINVGILSSLINPSDSVYRLAISTASGKLGQGVFNGFDPFGAALVPSGWMTLYTVIYITALFILAWRNFSRRDF